MLCPECTLYTYIIFVQACRHACRYRNIVVYGFHIVGTISRYRWLVRVSALSAVYVVWNLCGDYGLHAIFRGLQCTWLSVTDLPAHHCTARALYHLLVGTAGGEALVPHYYSASLVTLLRCHVVRNLAHEIRLQLAYVSEALLLHQCLTFCIALPSTCGSLVTTDVNLIVWEHLNHLVKHILREL